jgi:hypothetical protein
MGQVNRHRSAFKDSLDRSAGTVQPGQVILDWSAVISRQSHVSLDRSAWKGQLGRQPGQVSRDMSARIGQPEKHAGQPGQVSRQNSSARKDSMVRTA